MLCLEWIIKIGAAITAITGIILLVWRIAKYVMKMTKIVDYVFENIENVQAIPDIKRHTYENYMTSLRLTIMNSDMPIGERIAAGEAYLSEGGNGDVKHFLETELHIKDVQHHKEG